MTVVRALDAQLTASMGGPDSASIRDLGAALQTLLHAAPEPDAAIEPEDSP